MEFSDFCSHFLSMSDAEIVKDVRDSMKDMIKANPDGESFGAKMVRKANETASRKAETYRNNANARWHPETREQPNNPYAPQPQQLRPYMDKQEPTVSDVYNFARDNGLDEADARDFYEMTFVERNGRDKAGRKVRNWQGMLVKFCGSRARKRAV